MCIRDRACVATSWGVISLYQPGISDAVAMDVSKCLIMFACFMPFKMFNYVNVVGVLRSGGDTGMCLFIDTSGVWVIGIPLAFIGGLVLKLSLIHIFGNMAELLYLSKNGGLILEDELGNSYHSKLTEHYLNMIKDRDNNPGNVQMLFSTHDTKVLGFLNPGQIYLVDKDEQGATVVKLLDDFVIREKDNIELG